MYLVLVDRGSASACDDSVMRMSLSSRALLIGESSAGGSGQPRFKDWGNGMKLVIGARRQWFPDGRELEGKGVPVDIEVVPWIRQRECSQGVDRSRTTPHLFLRQRCRLDRRQHVRGDS